MRMFSYNPAIPAFDDKNNGGRYIFLKCRVSNEITSRLRLLSLIETENSLILGENSLILVSSRRVTKI